MTGAGRPGVSSIFVAHIALSLVVAIGLFVGTFANPFWYSGNWLAALIVGAVIWIALVTIAFIRFGKLATWSLLGLPFFGYGIWQIVFFLVQCHLLSTCLS